MAYAHFVEIAVDHTQCGGTDSSNFVVKVGISDPNLKTVGNGGLIQHTVTSHGQVVPADLAFASDPAITSLLNFEIEFYDGVAGTLVAHVQVPTLTHAIDLLFYLGYGDASVSTFQGNVSGTWESNYKGVYHLPDGTTLATLDSTGNANDATNHNAVAAAAGQIDGGASFIAANSQYLSAPAGFGGITAFTITFWANGFPNAGGFEGVLSKGTGGFSDFVIAKGQTGDFQKVVFYIQNSIGGNTGNTATTAAVFDFGGVAHHVVLTWDGTTVQAYVDGAADVTAALTGTLDNSDTTIAMGAYSTPSNYLNAVLDEITFAVTTRSADWVTATYNNQKTGSSFLTFTPYTPSTVVWGWSQVGDPVAPAPPPPHGWVLADPLGPPILPTWFASVRVDPVLPTRTAPGWFTIPATVPTTPAPTYFTDTYPDQVRAGTKAAEGWFTAPPAPPPAPPIIDTSLPGARFGVAVPRTTYTAPVTPPAAPAPTYFVDVFPDQVRRAGHAAPDWLTEPILPPPVPYTEWGQTEPLHPRVSWRDLTDYTEPLRIIQNPVPPLSWGVIYPDHLTVVRSAALLGAAYHAPYGPTPPPHERPLYRRSLQLRIGSRTEPEKL
jgi:hypothetical protein